ncbi:MAG TPA: hypothetical protein VGN12_25510 [Pirellulales bacterium]
MKFDRIEAPVAFSMVDHLDHPTQQPTCVFARYACCWMAFNNIYFVALRGKLATNPKYCQDRKPHEMPSEKCHLTFIASQIVPGVLQQVIESPSFEFFLTRRPTSLHGNVPDIQGVPPNGVTNIARSIYANVPKVSGLDRTIAGRVGTKNQLATDEGAVAAELVMMLYTIRNNMFHGGKEFDDPNANEVLREAYVILRNIVDSFLAT